MLAATLLNTLGYQVFIPIMPLYLVGHGASRLVVGVTTAGALLSYGVAQYPAGWLADRFDRRRFIAFATFLYALFFFVYLLRLPIAFIVPFRVLHAGVGGLYMPAALALLADLSAPSRLSRSFGLWQTTTMTGFLLGPLLGGVLAVWGLGLAFVAAGLMCMAAAIPALALPAARPAVAAAVELGAPAFEPRLWRALVPAVGVAAAPEYLQGLYTALWSLYLVARGGSTWQIGLSFTLFAVPAVVLSVWLGGLVDRRGPKLLMAAALILAGVMAPTYALIASVPLLIVLLMVEGAATAVEKPVIYREAALRVSPERRARAQGVLQMSLMVAQTLGALVGAWLFGFSPLVSFASISAVCLLSLLAVPMLRDR